MLHWPFRFPDNASRWLPGGDFKNSSVAAAANWVSLRSATALMLANRLDFPVQKRLSVSAHRNDWIMLQV
jgi:hypothetical protein